MTSTRTEIPTSTGLLRGWLGWFTSTGLAARPRGQLELWNQDGTRREKVIEPIFNRTVIFEIADTNFHAVRPVASGAEAARKSFAAYFHTVDGTIVPHSSVYAPSIYQNREGVLNRVARASLPPFIWGALRKLKKARASAPSPIR